MLKGPRALARNLGVPARQKQRLGLLVAVVRRTRRLKVRLRLRWWAGGEACLSPLGLSEGGGGAGAQHWLVNEGGREEADESLPAGEEGGGGEGSPHLFSLDGGEEEMEYCGAPEGGEAGRPRSLLSSSSDEESELRVQSGDEQVMEASDSAESFVTARKKESSRKHSGKLPGEGEGRKKKKKRI